MEEIWKDIEGYEDLYQVSSLGRIKSLERFIELKNGSVREVQEKIMYCGISNSGYYCTWLVKDKKKKGVFVHVLVAKAFIPNPENKREVDHLNFDKLDNKIENLCWATPKENTKRAFDELKLKGPWLGKLGKDNPKSISVNQYSLDGEYIKTYPCIEDVYRERGIKSGYISAVCKGKSKTALGYKWKYADENSTNL